MRLIDADSFIQHLHEPNKYGYSLIDHVKNDPTVPTFGQWISVKDALPKPGDRIMIYVTLPHNEPVQIDEVLEDADGLFLISLYEIGTDVTYWMPLTESPEVE